MIHQKYLRYTIKALYIFSWALVFLGFFISLYLFSPFGFLASVFCAILGLTPGLFGVVLVEFYLLQKQKLHELKEQRELLSSLIEKLSN